MFNENTTLEEILKTKEGKQILAKNGVPCVSCAMAKEEISFLKIGNVADMYGLDKEKIIKELSEMKE
jgi:hypothetical protein